MFAVPGWSLGALESQNAHGNQQNTKSSKKRKRDHREKLEPLVTKDNVATLWQQHVEKVKDGGSAPRPTHSTKPNDDESTTEKRPEESIESRPQSRRDRHEKSHAVSVGELPGSGGRGRNREEQRSNAIASVSGGKAVKRKTDNVVPTATSSNQHKLTPMQAAMRQKLVSARFRHLNQTLYTSPSAESRALFESNPSFYDEYHAGFRQQVSSWPENPVDSYVVELKERGRTQKPGKDKAKADQKSLQGKSQPVPLPRNQGLCTVADLGCGDGRIADQLKKMQDRVRLRILSYDLHSNNPLVTKCDIAKLPLEDGSVNVAIFCLALMGTNWIDFVEEAWRVLHWKGELWIAEIKSRFARAKRRRVDHSVGKRRKVGKQQVEDDPIDQQDQLRTEVDGTESNKGQTDVAAFVEVLERRGFALQGERGVDVSNKMFVKLRFSKSRTPTKGRNAEQGATGRPGGHGRNAAQAQAQARHQSDDVNVDEASVLKPCLYKIR